MKKLLLLAVSVFLFISCSSEDDPAQKDDIAIITTEFGDMHVLLYDQTPIHKENFLKLANEGFYDSTKFHRVIQGFMIQGGDPNSKDDNPMDDGQGGPGYTLEAEFDNQFIHKKGALAAARMGDQQNPERRSSGSQFYIVHGRPVQSMELDQMLAQRNELARQDMIRKYVQSPDQEELLNRLRTYMQTNQVDSVEAAISEIEPIATEGFVPTTYTPTQRDIYNDMGGTPFLDGNYTVFGEVIMGINIIDSIAVSETGQADRPLEDIPMTVRVETMDKAKIEQTYGYSYDQ